MTDSKDKFTWAYNIQYTSDGTIMFEQICACGKWCPYETSFFARHLHELEDEIKDWVKDHEDDVCPECGALFGGEY